MRKTVYGLVDTSCGFYLNLSGELVGNDCEKSKMDPAMSIYFGENQDEKWKEPSGIAVTHVNDFLVVETKSLKTVSCQRSRILSCLGVR